MNESCSLKCVSGAASPETFGINFVKEGTWVRSNGGKETFPTKEGKFGPNANPLETVLYKPDGETRVGSIGAFNPATAKKGDKGANGKSEESGTTFSWEVVDVVT